MPLDLDLVKRVINTHWISGVFVSGASRYADINAIIRYFDPKKQQTSEETGEQELVGWENRGIGPFGDVGEAMGGAYGKKVFVLVGAANSNTTHSYGVIAASPDDGKSWRQVYTGQKFDDTPTAVGSQVFGVVWDGKQFWAGYHESNNGDVSLGEVNEVDILLSSSDGISWSEVNRKVIDFYDWPAGYEHGFLATKCPDKGLNGIVTIKDENNNAVPSGIWDQTETTVIRPTDLPKIDYLYGRTGAGHPTGITRITVDTDGEKIEEKIDVGIPVYAVANVGGTLWVAGGGSHGPDNTAKSAYSLDDGKTWKKLNVAGQSSAIIAVMGKKKQETI